MNEVMFIGGFMDGRLIPREVHGPYLTYAVPPPMPTVAPEGGPLKYDKREEVTYRVFKDFAPGLAVAIVTEPGVTDPEVLRAQAAQVLAQCYSARRYEDLLEDFRELETENEQSIDRIAELEKTLRSIASQHTSDELRSLLDGHQDGDYEESHNTMIGIARAALGLEAQDDS